MKERIKKLTHGTILHAPLRKAYQFLFNRGSWNYHKQMLAFYGQWISKGDLVFDVGANVGTYTESFLELGARVVAIEPNPACAALLERIRPRNRIMVERVALGNEESEALLYMCESDVLSTLSPEWVSVAQHSRRFAQKEWNRTISVPVTTLDALISKHGCPQFIKIDVEGFESKVLDGLSHSPNCLSFEFNTELLDSAVTCVRKNCFCQKAKFNMVMGESLHLDLKEWVSKDEMIALLTTNRLRQMETNGDILVQEGA